MSVSVPIPACITVSIIVCVLVYTDMGKRTCLCVEVYPHVWTHCCLPEQTQTCAKSRI